MLWRILALLSLIATVACSREAEPVVLTIPPTPTEPEARAEPMSEPGTTPSAASTVAPSPTITPTSTATSVPPTSTASPTPSPSPTPSATPLPPTPTVAAGSVVIVDIIYDPPEGHDGDGETVFIANQSGTPVDLTDWTLSDLAEHAFVFPDFVLEPGATVAVHICEGEESADILYWRRCSAVWNNDGDTAFLHDATGREISTYSY